MQNVETPNNGLVALTPGHLRNRYLLLADFVALTLGTLFAFVVRFEGVAWPASMPTIALAYVMLSVPLRLGIFFGGGLYRRMWRHASVAELERLFIVGLVAAIATFALAIGVLAAVGGTPSLRVPLSVAAMDAVFTIAIPMIPRLWLRVARHRRARRLRFNDGSRVLIVGAGNAGQMIARELFGNPMLGMQPIGFVDDDPAKQNHTLYEVPVLGTLKDVAAIVGEHRIDRVIFAIPVAPGSLVRTVVQAATEAGAEIRIIPGLSELISGNVSVSTLRPVQIQDLLRRAPIITDLQAVSTLATDEVVMVTGAGGSIGSEMCRQLAKLHPKQLVLLGHGENSIFDICQELSSTYPHIALTPVIADVRDGQRMREVVQLAKPHVVFHAAAHKHVPLMEDNPAEAVTNNVSGTWNVAEAARHAGVKHFVLISTDKAVRPTSVMGATKRAAEMVVQLVASRASGSFVSVRFGNVLGSRGSVVPTFLRQIEAGGPITITDKEMRRYFMTIPEAVQLVLQAGAIGTGEEVFVLDMGAPVKIMDLASDLIRLSGLEVGRDIAIVCTGIRPGEKLYEETFFSGENVEPTVHPKVLRAKNVPLPLDVEDRLRALVADANDGASPAEIRAALMAIIPEYEPNLLTPTNVPVVHANAEVGTSAPVPRTSAPARLLN